MLNQHQSSNLQPPQSLTQHRADDPSEILLGNTYSPPHREKGSKANFMSVAKTFLAYVSPGWFLRFCTQPLISLIWGGQLLEASPLRLVPAFTLLSKSETTLNRHVHFGLTQPPFLLDHIFIVFSWRYLSCNSKDMCGQWHGSRFPDFRRSPSGERRCPGVEETFQTGSQPTIQKHNPAEQTSPRSTFAVVGSTLSAPPARAPDIKVGSRAGAPHCLVSRNVNNYHEREW